MHSGDATLLLPVRGPAVARSVRTRSALGRHKSCMSRPSSECARSAPPSPSACTSQVLPVVEAAVSSRTPRGAGPFNIQYISKDNDIKVIECNLRASRYCPASWAVALQPGTLVRCGPLAQLAAVRIQDAGCQFCGAGHTRDGGRTGAPGQRQPLRAGLRVLQSAHVLLHAAARRRPRAARGNGVHRRGAARARWPAALLALSPMPRRWLASVETTTRRSSTHSSRRCVCTQRARVRTAAGC